MTESQRQYVPRPDADEVGTALAFLDFGRECVIKKLDGLDEVQARHSPVTTGTSLLWLVAHLTVGERYWFAHQLAGEDDPAWDFDVDFDRPVPGSLTVDDVVADYRAAIAHSNEIVRRVGDPTTPMARPERGDMLSLRWVLAHMTGETVRHAGHADVLRELIDGVTGR